MIKKIALLLAGCALAAVLGGCGLGVPQSKKVLEMEAEDVLVLPDGQTVDCWREYYEFQGTDTHLPSGWVDYCLEDGTLLLREEDLLPPSLPETVPEQARQAIQTHYSRQGRLYSAESLLPQAYAAYQADPEGFENWSVWQNNWVVALAEQVVYLVTDVNLPLGGREQTSYQIGAAFDRTTGEKLSLWSLFTVPESEAKEALLAYLAPDDPCRAQMLEHLTEEMVVIEEGHYSICYPLDSLPGEQQTCRLGSELPEGLLHPWAVPVRQETQP